MVRANEESAQPKNLVLEAELHHDYRPIADLALPLANSGNANAQWWLGITWLNWTEDSHAKERPEHTKEEALQWIQRAAVTDLEASGFLAAAYLRGGHALPEDPDLAKCWERVTHDGASAAPCMRSPMTR